jgi:hypothetical protein
MVTPSQSLENFKNGNGYVIGDVWYPRVTSIVNIKAKPALYRFYAELNGFAEGEEIKKKSADEGTRVHEAAEAILTGHEPVIETDIAPAVRAFRAFVEEKNIQVDPEWVERRVVNHNERYAGTIDAVALIDGKLGVLDIKTSAGIFRDFNLQLAAYFPPLQEELRNMQTRWILRVDQVQTCGVCGATMRVKGGRVKIRAPYPRSGVNHKTCSHEWSDVEGIVELKEFPYWQDDYQAFLGAKKLWEWDNITKLKKIGYL